MTAIDFPSRRNFLLMGTSVLALTSCSSDWWNTVNTAWNKFVDDVTAIVAQGCGVVQGFIPTVQTIAAVVGALFPGAGVFVASIAGAVAAVADKICAAMPQNPTAAFMLRLAKSTENVPTVIGVVTVNGKPIEVHGYSRAFGIRRRHRANPQLLFGPRVR